MDEEELSDDETLNEDNVEEFAKGAIKKYFDKHMMVDALLWQSIVGILLNKSKSWDGICPKCGEDDIQVLSSEDDMERCACMSCPTNFTVTYVAKVSEVHDSG